MTDIAIHRSLLAGPKMFFMGYYGIQYKAAERVHCSPTKFIYRLHYLDNINICGHFRSKYAFLTPPGVIRGVWNYPPPCYAINYK